MKKAFFIVFVVLIVAGGFFVWQRTKPQTSVVPSPVVVEPTPTPVELATWEDANGFSFQYPKNLKLDVHDEDTVNYAHLEFTSLEHPGSVTVWGKDTNAVDAAAWVKAQKVFAGAVILDTMMSEKPGKKVLIETPKKQIVAAVVDEGVVFYVEGDLQESEFWTQVHTTITTSFTFIYNKPASGENDGVAVDEEEIVE